MKIQQSFTGMRIIELFNLGVARSLTGELIKLTFSLKIPSTSWKPGHRNLSFLKFPMFRSSLCHFHSGIFIKLSYAESQIASFQLVS